MAVGPWIEWAGGDKPVDDDVMIEVKFAGYDSKCDTTGRAKHFFWRRSRHNHFNIVAYRLLDTVPDNADAGEWEVWRDMGELVGRIGKALGFGHVAFHTSDQGLGFGRLALNEDGPDIGVFSIQWRFSAKGERYSRSFALSPEELSMHAGIAVLAESIADKMKSEARREFERSKGASEV